MIKKLYIAYGSNLSTEQMAFRCPDARPLGTTVLKDYELKFRGHSGVATIEKCKGSVVPVGIWAISASDELELDIYEGFPNLYRKEYLSFEFNGERLKGLVYVMQSGRKVRYPTVSYEEVIRAGYRDFGIDEQFLDDALEKCWEEVQKGKK